MQKKKKIKIPNDFQACTIVSISHGYSNFSLRFGCEHPSLIIIDPPPPIQASHAHRSINLSPMFLVKGDRKPPVVSVRGDY